MYSNSNVQIYGPRITDSLLAWLYQKLRWPGDGGETKMAERREMCSQA